MELVTVKNLDTKPLELKHDGMGDISIPPGTDRTVPFEYAAISFGHPAARNDGREKARDREYASCRTMWGFYPGIDAEDEWPDYAPKFEVTDLEGERIWMVLDDPDGSKGGVRSDETTDLDDTTSLRAAMADMQRQMEHMQAIIAAQAASEAAVATPEAAPVPEPQRLPDPSDSHDDQTERNERRDELPKPVAKVVGKDKPRTSRAGGR